MHARASHRHPARYRLVTLGRLTLLSPAGCEDPSLGTRRRKLAVLTYLALRGRPVTRDHLAALFWGGKDDARAKNSLSDAISHLRRVLGRNALETKGDEVALGEDAAIDIDAFELRAAVDAQCWPRAVDLYGGPFLDGVHIDDAVEFEQWRSSEELRLRGLFTKACAAHVPLLAQSEQTDACAAAAARWLEAEPASVDAALFRLNALRAPRTNEANARALAEYERVRAQLAEELGAGVDPMVERLAAAIRNELPPILSTPGTAANVVSSPNGDELRASLPDHAPDEKIVTSREPNPVTRLRVRGPRFAAALVAAATLAVAIASGMRRPTTDDRPVLAILPFENVGSASDAYFADGLTDEVRSRLTGIAGLRVIGGSSMRRYSGTTKTPGEIARELGATHLLRGSVRWEHASNGGGRVRVSPELVRATDQASVWAAPVEGTLDDVFAMQAHVAERVASALDVALHLREVAARPTTNLAAYDAYLRGRTAVSSTTTFSAADRRTIREELERAVTLDPQFAAAHTQLAWSHFNDYQQAGDADTRSEALKKFRAESRRAWELDSTAVDTRLVHARDLELAGDAITAARLVRETARNAPGNVNALGALAEVEWSEGKYDAAILANRRAMELDPFAANAWKPLAGELDRLYRYDEAISVRERELDVTPNSDVAYAVQASSHLLRRGDTTQARQTLERGSVSLPWVVRLPGGVAGIAIWTHALPAAVIRARDTLTLAGYLAGPGGIAPELYHLLELRHFVRAGRADLARLHADSLVARLAPVLQSDTDAPWFFWWFSRRSVLAEAYATLGRTADAAQEADVYVAETRRRRTQLRSNPEQLCHALHNAAYVDVLIGRTSVATARLAEALELPCGHRVSRALLRADSAWAPLWKLPSFARLVADGREATRR